MCNVSFYFVFCIYTEQHTVWVLVKWSRDDDRIYHFSFEKHLQAQNVCILGNIIITFFA